MKKQNMQIIVLLFLLLVTSACRSIFFPLPEKEVLQNRLTAMMSARSKQDWASVYLYICPEYKKKVSKENFMGMTRNISYSKDFSIESIEIGSSGKKATVTVKYDMNIMEFDVPGHRETQKWIKTDNEWFYQMNTDPLSL